MAAPTYAAGSGAAKSMDSMSGHSGPALDIQPPAGDPLARHRDLGEHPQLDGKNDAHDDVHAAHELVHQAHEIRLDHHGKRIDDHADQLSDHGGKLSDHGERLAALEADHENTKDVVNDHADHINELKAGKGGGT